MSIPFLFVIAMIIATVYLGFSATRKAKTASDFFVAARSVGVMMNASAISGEYLSAASFMGVAGLIMKSGYDALWYPVCYAAGYLLLLLFIAGPLRRFGAYTIPDFAQGRFDSPMFRKVAVIFVLCIGFFYTMPQMKGAGTAMGTILGWPYWVGVVVVGAVITFNVSVGGMKGITIVQAFQYWAKVFAISAPIFVLMAIYGGYNGDISKAAETPKDSVRLSPKDTATINGAEKAPLNTISMPTTDEVAINFQGKEPFKISKITTARKPEAGEDPVAWSQMVRAVDPSTSPLTAAIASGKPFEIPAGETLVSVPVHITHKGIPVVKDFMPIVTSAKIEFEKGGKVTFSGAKAGSHKQYAVMTPNAPPNGKWVHPFGPFTSTWGYPVLYTYSLIIALVCGTAGLPHILVRFYTNPDGRAAKKTTLWVMILLGAFYIFPPMWGVLERNLMPSLYVNSGFDSGVIKLPTLLENKLLGQILSGVTSAGAFAAFMSTFSGLLVSMAGAFAHDIYGNIIKPGASSDDRLKAFKIAAVGVGATSIALGLFVETFDIAMMVGWAFAIGAASYFPLLLLGSWWRGLTKYGAAAGMLLGGTLSFAAIVFHMCLTKGFVKAEYPPLFRALLEQPAIWGVPLSILTMVIVSLMTKDKIPPDITMKMLRLHAPEEMGISRNYIEG